MARILVVDDNSDWQTTLKGLLDDQRYQVVTAGDEAEALAAAVQTSFDLAVIDVRLHGDADDDSGISLALALKKLIPQMKIILLTGYRARADQVVKSIRFVGVENFIEKSDLEGGGGVNLAKTIESVLGEPSFESEIDQLSLSLEPDQPIVIRARGSYVHALRTRTPLRLSVQRYNRQAQEARVAPNPRFNVKTIGENLYRDIFKDCQEALVTFTAAQATKQPLCLSFEGDRELIGVPIEFIFLDQPADYLVLQHPVTRFVNGAVPGWKALSPQTFTQLKGQLRVLIVASNTHPPIPGVDQEAQQLAHFLESQQYVNVEVDLISTEEATISRIRKELKNCQAHILHYAGHGWYNESSPEESELSFWSPENGEGTVEAMTAAELKVLLQDSEVRLAYFSSCYGATAGLQAALLDDDFLGIADAVTQAGVPSTLGFRWPVSDEGAPKLAKAFYKSLFKQGSPEIALWEARRELAGPDLNDPTWLSPILIHQV